VSKLGEGRTILAIFLLGFALYFVVAALDYGKNSRLFPVAIGVPTAILTALTLAALWRPGLLRTADVNFGAAASEAMAAGPDEGWEPTSATRVLRMLGWLFLALVGVGLVGFAVAVPIYILLFSRIEGRTKWGACILTALITWAFMVGYFDLFMQFKMFRGVLFGDILPAL
jgi:hypothetical protein